jgi:predicted nucleic acid-binding protein
MILAETSAWVEFGRATGSRVDERVAALIGDDGPLAVTEPVLMEVLAGARTEAREDDLRRLLLRFEFLPPRAGVRLRGSRADLPTRIAMDESTSPLTRPVPQWCGRDSPPTGR